MDSYYKDSLKERMEQYGIETLLDEETVSLLTGIPLQGIKKGIECFGLPELVKFIATLNLTKTQRNKLELLFSFAKRLQSSDYKVKTKLGNSDASGQYFLSLLQYEPIEMFVVALLDSQNRLLQTEVLSKGTINETPIYPREVIKLALKYNASSVMVAHNHPSGSKKPSNQDINATKTLKDGLRLINISLIDHIIIAENSFVSLAEQGHL